MLLASILAVATVERVLAVLVVHFLASPAASWVNGTDVPVDHGAEIAEFLAAHGVIDRLVARPPSGEEP